MQDGTEADSTDAESGDSTEGELTPEEQAQKTQEAKIEQLSPQDSKDVSDYLLRRGTSRNYVG